MVNDSEYFKKRYKLFIRFIKENNLYVEVGEVMNDFERVLDCVDIQEVVKY